MEERSPLKVERTPCEYTREALQTDVQEWIEGPAVSSDRDRIKGLPFVRQFLNYQNNFWSMVRSVRRYINDDGSINEDVILKENMSVTKEDPKWAEYVQYYEKIVDSNHAREIYQVCEKLSYDSKEMTKLQSPLTDEQGEMLINIWVEMRKLGFSRMELIG